jgi:hypothetical protein
MRSIHIAATLMLTAATASAAEDPAPALKGKWKLDKAATAEASPEYAKGSPAQQTEIKERHAALRDTTFEFDGNELYYGHDGSVPDLPQDAVPGDVDAVDQMDIQFQGPDVIDLVHNDIPYTLSLRRVK